MDGACLCGLMGYVIKEIGKIIYSVGGFLKYCVVVDVLLSCNVFTYAKIGFSSLRHCLLSLAGSALSDHGKVPFLS